MMSSSLGSLHSVCEQVLQARSVLAAMVLCGPSRSQRQPKQEPKQSPQQTKEACYSRALGRGVACLVAGHDPHLMTVPLSRASSGRISRRGVGAHLTLVSDAACVSLPRSRATLLATAWGRLSGTTRVAYGRNLSFLLPRTSVCRIRTLAGLYAAGSRRPESLRFAPSMRRIRASSESQSRCSRWPHFGHRSASCPSPSKMGSRSSISPTLPQ